jgi:hypothetical protein
MCPAEEVDGLDELLGSLVFTWRDQPFRADRQGLTHLGRSFAGDANLGEHAAMCEGAKQFKVNIEDLRTALRSNRWAKEHCLVAVAGGQGDGTSGVRADDGSFAARRQTIEALADIVFSANPQQVRFWLGEGADSPQRVRETYRGLKPCLHGSDAHDAASLGMPNLDRFTWLKGDASFETLRMTCLVPESRCEIGPTPPAAGDGSGRISSVSVTRSEWFASGTVPINPGLVAVIGARGSGKTALADLVAVGAGSLQPFETSASFVHRARRLLGDATAEVEWSHGETTRHSLCELDSDGQGGDRGVRYLSQQFVEKLCAADGMSDDLLAEIERVVFNAWPVDQRQGAISFDEFLTIRLSGARSRQQAELDAIAELGEDITSQRMLKESLPGKVSEQEEQQRTLVRLENETNELTRQGARGSVDRLGVVSGVLERRRVELQAADRRMTALRALKDEVGIARDSKFPRHLSGLRDRYRDARLTDGEWETFNIAFTGDVDTVVEAALQTERDAYRIVAGAPDADRGVPSLDDLSEGQLAGRSVAELSADQQRLQHLLGLDQVRTNKLRSLNDQSARTRALILRLEAEIKSAEDADQQIVELTDRRFGHYATYFDALLEEERQLQELYAPLSDLLAAFGASVAKLRLSVLRAVDVEAWAAKGEALLDLRKAGRFRGIGELVGVARDELCQAWQLGDGQAAAAAIRGFSANYSSHIRDQSRVSRDDSDAYREWERSVARWLYSADHVALAYAMEYDGLNIERLSPGSRGIVLLLLYLAVDQEETDPLLIDQPEENLDPESVYSELVDLFRKASNRRQIIMVTHNANLVVNTDVDQVIVARCGALEEGRLPELTYLSGGLEQPTIRKAVCEVLEGGAEAFRQRARRLGIDLSP